MKRREIRVESDAAVKAVTLMTSRSEGMGEQRHRLLQAPMKEAQAYSALEL